MKTTEINIDEQFNEAVALAQKTFFEGGIFVYPTDTIYGFGANPFNSDAVMKLTTIKQREENKRYILLVDSIETVLRYADIKEDNHADFLLSIWPNPITVVLPLKEQHSKILGVLNAGFRIPNHVFCQKLLSGLKIPLISTSVNRSGEDPLNDYTQIKQEFNGEIDALFFSVKKQLTLASTVIKLEKNSLELLREGRINFSEIFAKFVKNKSNS